MASHTTKPSMRARPATARGGHYFFGNIGYRYQPSHGFQFRAGISPSFNLGGDHAVSKNLVPYISFGYVF